MTMNSIFDHFEDIYNAEGWEAQDKAEREAWKLLNEDEEAFKAFAAENNIDLEIYSIDWAVSDFEMWCDEVEFRVDMDN